MSLSSTLRSYLDHLFICSLKISNAFLENYQRNQWLRVETYIKIRHGKKRICLGARRISFRVFKLIAYEWDAELNTRREILYLQATIYHFVYYINAIALHWQEKPTLLTNESKTIDIPRIKIVKCVDAKAQDKTMRWMATKTTTGVIFNVKISQRSTLSLLKEEIFEVLGWNRPVANLTMSISVLIIKCCHQSHWNRKFQFLFSYFGSRKVWTSLSVSDTVFSAL